MNTIKKYIFICKQEKFKNIIIQYSLIIKKYLLSAYIY